MSGTEKGTGTVPVPFSVPLEEWGAPMDTNPGIIFVVTAIDRADHSEHAVLAGFDFGSVFGKSLPMTRDCLFALTKRDIHRVDGSKVRITHRRNAGWTWTVGDVERYPEPPFLLTDDPSIRSIFHGNVLLYPTEEARSLIAGELKYYGKCETPIQGENWFGWLTISSTRIDQGLLLAFSGSVVELQQRVGEVRMADNDEVLGSIEMPQLD